jgi:hypothetical protein
MKMELDLSPAGRLAVGVALRRYAKELRRDGFDQLADELDQVGTVSPVLEHRRMVWREKKRRQRARRKLYGDRGGFASERTSAEAER